MRSGLHLLPDDEDIAADGDQHDGATDAGGERRHLAEGEPDQGRRQRRRQRSDQRRSRRRDEPRADRQQQQAEPELAVIPTGRVTSRWPAEKRPMTNLTRQGDDELGAGLVATTLDRAVQLRHERGDNPHAEPRRPGKVEAKG